MSQNIVTNDAGAQRSAPTGPIQLARHLISTFGSVFRGGSERSRVQRTALSAFAIRVASALIAYFVQVLLARWMGSFEYGIFVFVWVWVLILGGEKICDFGCEYAMAAFEDHRHQFGVNHLCRADLVLLPIYRHWFDLFHPVSQAVCQAVPHA